MHQRISARQRRHIKQLFAGALARPATSREAWLVEASASAAVRAEVRELLTALDQAGNFLEGTLSPSRHRFAPGDTLSRYAILGLLGTGGMGEVYQARDTRLDRIVVLKVLPIGMAAGPEWRARLEREAQAVSSLNHPHVCSLYDIGQEGGVDFLVMEYLDGETLATHLSHGALPLDDVLVYSTQIADALDAAHQHGIVHRDLKPANIMLTASGATLLDFGIARPAPARTEPSPNTVAMTTSLTHDGALVGTAGYMAPEQIRGEPVDARADIFALGAVIHEMATASKAFPGDDGASILDAVLTRDVLPMRQRRTDTPRSLERVVRKCLAKDARARYQAAADVRRDLTEVAAQRRRQRLVWRVVAAAVFVMACAGLGQWLASERASSGPEKATRTVLAVMPFANPSGNTEQEYLSEGLTTEIITGLAQVDPERLSVIGRASAVRFHQTHADLSQLHEVLGVDYVVEGTVARAGPSVRIDVRLTNARDRSQLWSERYERQVDQINAMRADVVRSIAREIAVTLTPAQTARLDAAPPVDPDAYEHYLRGRYFWEKRTERGLRRAVEEFDAAIRRYPGYAAAHAGMASSYVLLAYYAYDQPDHAFSLARAASTKALAIDDRLADAHVSLAGIYSDYEYRWRDAEREYQAALRLDPNHATAHQWYANHLIGKGRRDEAQAHILRARELEPLSLIIQVNVANIYLLSRQYDRAIAECRKALEMEEEFVTARWVLGRALEFQGHHRAAAGEFERALEHEPDSTRVRAALARSYALSGDTRRSEDIVGALRARAQRQHVSELDLASVQAALGRIDDAFASLQRAARGHANLISYLAIDPAYDSLRSDPRFRSILTMIGLE